MRSLLTSVALLLAGTVGAAPTAFVNVNVLPMTSETVLAGRTVIVEDGLISAIGAVDSTPIPEEAVVVDGTDRYLMPGLAEMHAHVPTAPAAVVDRVLTLFAANGVTLIRGMLGDPAHLQLREQLASGEVFGPRLVTSGPSFNGRSVSGADDADARARAQHAAGYDFLKIHPGLTLAEFDAVAAAANDLGIPFAGHVPVEVGLQHALESGMATIDHLDGYLLALLPADTDPSGGFGGFFDVLLADSLVDERIDDLAAQTAAAGTWNVATEALIEHRVGTATAAELAARPEMRYMPRSTVAQWISVKERQEQERGFDAEVGARAIAIRRQLIFALHEAGAGLLLGSDAPQVFNVPGFSLHDELGFLVAAGLSPYAALRTGTVAVAEFLASNSGRIEVGRDADLVLLDANPLEDIGNARRVHGVMLQGRWYSSPELQQRLAVFRDATD